MTATARLVDARSAAANLATLLAAEQGAMADFLLALAAFDVARGWAALGHANLFAFLHRDLRLSRSAAFQRKAAAGLIQRFPAIEAPLRNGRLCLSSLYELSQVLTEENAEEVLPRFFGLSAREARELVAELAPRPAPPVRELVTAVAPPTPPAPAPARVQFVLTSEQPGASTPRNDEVVPREAPQQGAPQREDPAPALPTPVRRPPDANEPLTADLRRLHITVSRRFLEKLDAAREARSHARPGATTESILEEALELLLAREEKRRTAATERPRRRAERRDEQEGAEPTHRPDPGEAARHIPAEVRRQVWARDGGRCAWPLDGGGTCGSSHRLQLDHVVPVARGGQSTAANVRMLCEAHNREAARRILGTAWMEGRLASGVRGRASPRAQDDLGPR